MNNPLFFISFTLYAVSEASGRNCFRATGTVCNQRSAVSGRLSCIVNQTGLEEPSHEKD